MSLSCCTVFPVAGIDWNDPDPDAGWTMREVRCPNPAAYANRTDPFEYAVCEDCYGALAADERIDIWPITAGQAPPAASAKERP